MHNAFLVIRTVFFALLAYTHVLILIFALWNIIAAKSSGMSTPGASVFLLMSSVLIFVFVPMAYLAELICARARPAQVRVECAWTVLMSTFQLAASISVTVNGPPVYCRMQSPWTMCASTSLLVYISWLATLIILSYCLTICVASSTHAAYFPDIWITPVSHVPWFRPDIEAAAPVGSSHPSIHKHKKSSSSSSSWSEASCALSKYIAERWEKLSHTERQPASGPILFSRGHQSMDASRPTWARQYRVRRGIDSPFAQPLPKCKELSAPPRTHSRHVVSSWNSRFVMAVSEQSEGTAATTTTPRTVFPLRAGNPDHPIPLPSLSEWVRADAAKGNVVPQGSIPLP